MSTFYGQVEGMAYTNGTRRGGRYIHSSSQSYDGSVDVELRYYDDNHTKENLMVYIGISDDSSMYGANYFTGTIDELRVALSLWRESQSPNVKGDYEYIEE